MKEGDFITLGCYEGEPIVWRALTERDGKWLMLSRDILEIRQYHPEDAYEHHNFGEDFRAVDWSSCELREWLNGAFFEKAFTAEEAEKIQREKVYYSTQYKTLHSRFSSERSLEDKVFVLSYGEMTYYLPDSKDRYAGITAHAKEQLTEPCPLRKNGSWWVRNHSQDNSVNCIGYFYNFMDSGLSDKTVGTAVDTKDVGVRPAIWIKVEE